MTDYASFVLHPRVALRYARGQAYFECHCRAVGLPARLTLLALLTCLARRAESGSAVTTQSLLSALRWYARRHGDVEVTFDPAVRDFMAGLYRLKPRTPHPPLEDAQLEAIAAQFGDAPLDRRDHALYLCSDRLMLPLRVLQQLRRSDLHFHNAGMSICVRLWNDRVIEVEHDENVPRCVVCALSRWLETRRLEGDGLIFVGRSYRGGFLETPVNHHLVNTALQRAAFRTYGMPLPISNQRLRSNAIREACKTGRTIVICHRSGLTVYGVHRLATFDEVSRANVRAVQIRRSRGWANR